MWVVLEFYNAYDQYGGYFTGIFDSKENAENSVDHVGRSNNENNWYEIEEVEVNKLEPTHDS